MQPIGCDCYPYNRSSSDARSGQVTGDSPAEHYDYVVGAPSGNGRQARSGDCRRVGRHAAGSGQAPATAGAVYSANMSRGRRAGRILSHPATMVGSDGLPNDPLPHPRLWGRFRACCGLTRRATPVCCVARGSGAQDDEPRRRAAWAFRRQRGEGCIMAITRTSCCSIRRRCATRLPSKSRSRRRDGIDAEVGERRVLVPRTAEVASAPGISCARRGVSGRRARRILSYRRN